MSVYLKMWVISSIKLSGLRCRIDRWFFFWYKLWDSRLLLDEVMDYLTLCYLHSTPHPLLPSSCCCCSVGKWMAPVCYICISLTNSTMLFVYMCALIVHVDLLDWLWDLRCVVEMCLCGCVWPGHLVLCMQAWSRLISCLQKLAIKSWSGCQFKWNEMEPESN